MEAGNHNTKRNIAIHDFASSHGQILCSILPAIHHLTGSDYTSKIGTKLSGLNANPEIYLKDLAHGKIFLYYLYGIYCKKL